MVAPKKGYSPEAEARFTRAVWKAALEFAPSAQALHLAIARHVLNEDGFSDFIAQFDGGVASGPKGRTTSKANATTKTKPAKTKRSALEPTTPITEALSGVRRHGTFEANGIITLADASKYRESELRAIQGIGPGLISALNEALPRASLALREEEAA